MPELDLLTDKSDFLRAQWRESPAPPPGGVTLEPERFALTANNFTYMKLGEALGYWRYFPAEPGFARMPVWGLARIVRCDHPALREGERVFGLLPISTRLTLEPEMRGALRFVDAAPHRADLPPAYNDYALVDRDPAFDPAQEDAYIALRPLFILGFFLAEWLARQNFFGAERAVVSSASSKAALALAHQLGGRIETLGLTSARHAARIESLRMFDAVASYAAIGEDLAARSAVVIDIAGDPGLTQALSARLGGQLLRVVRVGATHGDVLPGAVADATFFFAPAEMAALRAQWGADRLRVRLAAAWANFLASASAALLFQGCSGRAEIDRVYREVGRGEGEAGIVPILADLREP